MRKITRSAGEVVIIGRDDWEDFLASLKAALGGEDQTEALRGCLAFCREACRDSSGCDFSWGSEGSCGAACESGDVFLE